MMVFHPSAMFAATMFLAGRCSYRMTRSLQRPLLVQFFQRMSWSMTRPLLAFFWKQRAVLEAVSTQTDGGRDQAIRLPNCQIQILEQQLGERDGRTEDLESLVHYYEGDVTTTPLALFVSRTSARYHLSRDCRALSQANPAGIRNLTCCSQCTKVLRDNSNLGGPWLFFLLSTSVSLCHKL